MRKVVVTTLFVFAIGLASYLLYANNTNAKTNLDFLAEANNKAKEQDESAFVYLQKAMLVDTKDPMMVAKWEYWAFGKQKGVFVLHFDGFEWKTEKKGDLVGGPMRINLMESVKMDVAGAWKLVNEEDFGAPITSWQLYIPMSAKAKNPMYFFAMEKGEVSVDTKTLEVFEQLKKD